MDDDDLDSRQENMQRVNRFLAELTQSHSPTNIEIRAENAYGVAVKFLDLLRKVIDDDEERRKVMSSWFKAVRDSDYKKFKRSFRKYMRHQIETPDHPDEH